MTTTATAPEQSARPVHDDTGVDLNRIVAYNFRAARILRRWTQKDAARRLEPYLGQRMTQAGVSSIERAWDGDRRREFDAHELLVFGVVFELPVVWYLLPPPGDDRRLRRTRVRLSDLAGIVVGRPEHLEPLYRRLRQLSHEHPEAADRIVDQIAGNGTAGGVATYRRRRSQMLRALLDPARADRLDQAAAELGACFDQVRRLGIRAYLDHTQDCPSPAASATAPAPVHNEEPCGT